MPFEWFIIFLNKSAMFYSNKNGKFSLRCNLFGTVRILENSSEFTHSESNREVQLAIMGLLELDFI